MIDRAPILLAACLALAACGDDPDPSPGSASTAEAEALRDAAAMIEEGRAPPSTPAATQP